jgi:hypothetical protein
MTTDFNYSRTLGFSGKPGDASVRSVLFSPLMVLFLVVLVFVFFLTASRGSGYLYQSQQEREIIKTEFDKEQEKKTSALRYERIVTGADPIRSILQ